jgi:hypothetical protein
MYHNCAIPIIAVTLALTACATPNIDTSAQNFNEEQYTADLNNCQGGSTLYVAMNGLGGAVVGSALGALHGAYYGAIARDAPKGAIIGAAVGTVVGTFVGAVEPFQKQEEKVAQCLAGKGYVVGTSS